jgi:hypothetical protein
MGLYNRKGIFGNAVDNRDELEAALSHTCPRFELEVVGSVALFAGSVEGRRTGPAVGVGGH